MLSKFARGRVVRSALIVVIALALFSFLSASSARPASAASQSTFNQYRAWMASAKAMYPYPQSLDKMWRVMMCESSGNLWASQGHGKHVGLYQYAPATWRGRWNPYRYNNIWDARSQIYATAKAWSIGMQSAWSCYYITKGR